MDMPEPLGSGATPCSAPDANSTSQGRFGLTYTSSMSWALVSMSEVHVGVSIV